MNPTLSVKHMASSPRPSPPAEEREIAQRRLGGPMREFLEGDNFLALVGSINLDWVRLGSDWRLRVVDG